MPNAECECGMRMRNAECECECGMRNAECGNAEHGTSKAEGCEASRVQSAPMKRLVIVLAVVVAGASAAAQPGRRSISLIVGGGTVITQNSGHQIVNPGSVAIDGTDIVEIGAPDAIAAKYQARETVDA